VVAADREQQVGGFLCEGLVGSLMEPAEEWAQDLGISYRELYGRNGVLFWGGGDIPVIFEADSVIFLQGVEDARISDKRRTTLDAARLLAVVDGCAEEAESAQDGLLWWHRDYYYG
jgi:hypothetical protein